MMQGFNLEVGRVYADTGGVLRVYQLTCCRSCPTSGLRIGSFSWVKLLSHRPNRPAGFN